ncbi:Tricarboxylate transport protein TctB [Nitrincola lacisaponensis]|uniref:Tricarboxylate transport protein TctB n=1 Tax=Nitrincola lacisaponensis TaxID=267850 RepID=A0A063Y2L2_9GAMM|nr:tripartite tricarboxylate transporter TctB family protein [Nitrincola lacisaponensis]KDE38777.1 Tricarboxylate transport protein TctB [Nitrincola lacisaponensis]
MKAIHLDLVIGAIMLMFSAVFYSLSVQMPSDPAVFPKLILATLMAFSAYILVNGISKTWTAKKQGVAQERVFKQVRGPIVTFVALCVYVILIDVLGFFVSSTLAAVFFMRYFGVSSYLQMLLVLIIMNSFIYMLFVWQLRISLPTGLLL